MKFKTTVNAIRHVNGRFRVMNLNSFYTPSRAKTYPQTGLFPLRTRTRYCKQTPYMRFRTNEQARHLGVKITKTKKGEFHIVEINAVQQKHQNRYNNPDIGLKTERTLPKRR